jgi:drug/metabolite transporter (DMT)-like permease
MTAMRRLANVGGLSLVNLMWASQFPAYRVAVDHLSVSALSFYTFVVAILLLLPFLLWERRRRTDKRHTPTQRRSWRTIAVEYLLLGVLGLIPPSILMSWGIEHSSGSNAAILTLTIPLLMVAVAVPLLGERLTWTRIGVLALALIGAVFISKDDMHGSSFTSSTLIGNLVVFGACLGSAFYNIYSKRLFEHQSELEVLVYGYIVGAALCGLASWLLDARSLFDVEDVPASTWIAVAVLGSLTWGYSMLLFMWLLRRLDIALISVSIYMLSFFGVLLSAVMLGERVRLMQLLGGLVIFTAALLSDSYERRVARGVSLA